MNEHAVAWLNRFPLRYAIGGGTAGLVFTLLMLIRMLFYVGDEPVLGMTVFLGAALTLVFAMFSTMLGFSIRTDLARLKERSDADVIASTRILPMKYAMIGLLIGLGFAGNAWYELRSDPAYAFPVWIVIVVGACMALIGLLLGRNARAGLHRRLAAPPPAAAVPPMPAEIAK